MSQSINYTELSSGNVNVLYVYHFQDEVHERDRFSDFLLTALRDQLSKYPHMKLILMSASMNVDMFIRYFNNCPVLRCRFDSCKYMY